MKDFLFRTNTQIRFGQGASLQLGTLLRQYGYRRPFVVTGNTVKTTEPFQAMLSALGGGGFEPVVFAGSVVDPTVESADEAAKALKASGCDCIVAAGGGSCIDTAKAMSLLATHEGSIRDYLFGGCSAVARAVLPLVCVPTTAGSGSEVTASSVLTDTQNDIKLSVTHDSLMPKCAVIDPLMHVGMPEFITSTTGMDALTHAIEAYVSKNANPVSDAYAASAIGTIGKYLRTAVFDPQNIEARSQMATASSLAAIAFMNAGLGAVHGISQSMGGVAHVAHGYANAMLLPHVMVKNAPGNLDKFASIASLLGEGAGVTNRGKAFAAADAVAALLADIRIPPRLRDAGVRRDMFDRIVKGTMGYRLLSVNPIRIAERDVYDILESAF